MQPLDNLDQESPLRYDSTSLEETRALCQLWTSLLLPGGRTTSALSLGKRSVVPLQGERAGRDYSRPRGPCCVVHARRGGDNDDDISQQQRCTEKATGIRLIALHQRQDRPDLRDFSAQRGGASLLIVSICTTRRGRQSSSGGRSSVR